MENGPGRDERRPPVPRSALLATTLAAVVLAAAGLGGLAWWLIGPDGGVPLAGVALSGTSEDRVDAVGHAFWDHNDDGTPVRWDPCSPIELVIAPAGMPDGARADLDEAVARLRAVTGLDLVVSGETDERPAARRPPYQPERYGERWAPVLVAWEVPADSEMALRSFDRGIATPVAVGRPGQRTYVSGQVVLNGDRDDLRAGFLDRSNSWGATIVHELAHILGLAHVGDPDELMAVHPGDGPVDLGPGDRTGLRAVGADGGCVVVPTPQPVEVAVAIPR